VSARSVSKAHLSQQVYSKSEAVAKALRDHLVSKSTDSLTVAVR
jgi:hypothetical protein